MSRRRPKDDSFVDGLYTIFMRVPPWLCIPVAVFIYFFINGVILTIANASPVAKAVAGLVPYAGMFIGCIVLLAGGAAAFSRMQRKDLYADQTSIDSIRALSWARFEQLIGEAYRRQGFEVQENLRGGADGGVDLRLRKGHQVTLVQCKQWKAFKVGVQTVRELFGVITAEKAHSGILVTSGVFTTEAKEWASGKPVELIDGNELCRLIGHIQPTTTPVANGVSPSPTTVDCPNCGKAMVLRTAKKGANAGSQFWGCTGYPSCKGTRDFA